jgi:serine phosphatase RsbU (regulator of sigma subunit)
MQFTLTDIIIIITSLICVISGLLLFYLLYKKRTKNIDKQLLSVQKKYAVEIDYMKSEILRLNFIISKKQNTLINNQHSETDSVITFPEQTVDNFQLAELTSDNEKLEDEKRKFQEKNKKLWEQSIAIHKEKERIDILKKEIESKHRHVTDSIKYAKNIQNALLPTDEQLKTFLREYFVFWKPRDIVSGDFYWITKYKNNVIFAVADCTGHGVPGAFMSALGIAFLNEIVSKHQNLKANEILEKLRILIKLSLKQTTGSDSQDGMDLALCIFNDEEKKLSFAGANNPLYLFRNNELIVFEPTRNPVGIYQKEVNFENIETEIKENDIFYMFTDGYADEFGGENGRKLTRDGFKNLIIEINQNNHPISVQKQILKHTMDLWLGEKYSQIDDILVVGFKI